MATGDVIRRLRAGERDRVRAHLLRLDAEDRHLRFGGHASAAHITAYCEGLEWSRQLVLGYIVAAQVRGVGELKPIGTGASSAAELAVSVERPFQNRGVGSALLRRLVIAARNRLITRIHMVCLIENGRAVRMARRLDGALVFDGGEAEARIEPPWPTPWTWLEELLLELGGAEVRPRAAELNPDRIPSPDQVITEGAVRPVRARIPAN